MSHGGTATGGQGRRWRLRSKERRLGRNQLCPHLVLGLLTSRNVRKHISVSKPVSHLVLQSPSKLTHSHTHIHRHTHIHTLLEVLSTGSISFQHYPTRMSQKMIVVLQSDFQ